MKPGDKIALVIALIAVISLVVFLLTGPLAEKAKDDRERKIECYRANRHLKCCELRLICGKPYKSE